MIEHPLRRLAGGLLAVLLVGLLLAGWSVRAQDKPDKDKLDLDKMPKVVMDALKAKFSKAVIHKWTKAKEGNDVVYDIEFKENGRACEADIKEDGTYVNYEKAIEAKNLPKAVVDAIEKKYPKASLKEIMEETEVKGKDENLSAYEVVLVTADKKDVELRLSPDGKILEDSGDMKEEKK
ncbi:MAG: PepSY-like domain-containing protein [Terriglobia bacterium]